jgi:hypothetical protein
LVAVLIHNTGWFSPRLIPGSPQSLSELLSNLLYKLSLRHNQDAPGIETKWFALTGRVVAAKAETDGALHIAVQDATGDKPGIAL